MPTMEECSDHVAEELRSDKGADYLKFYEHLLSQLGEDHALNVVEVGVFKGGWLLALAQRLPRARFLGIDIESPPALFFEELERLGLDARVTFKVGSQFDRDLLDGAIRDAFGGEKVDLVTEDAVHTYAGSRSTFESVFMPWVREGGVYAIEDWGTGYWPAWQDGHPDGQHGMVKLIKELIDVTALSDRIKLYDGQRALSLNPGAATEPLPPITKAEIVTGVAAFWRGPGTWLPPLSAPEPSGRRLVRAGLNKVRERLRAR